MKAKHKANLNKKRLKKIIKFQRILLKKITYEHREKFRKAYMDMIKNGKYDWFISEPMNPSEWKVLNATATN